MIKSGENSDPKMCGGVLMMIQRENMREKIKGINFFFQ